MIEVQEGLFYRRLEREDLAHRVQWVNDPEINQTLTFDVPVSQASTEAWFSKTVLDSSKVNLMFFVREEGGFIPLGFGGFLNIDRQSRKGELYITIGDKKYQGKGLAKVLVNFLCDFGFNELGLHKVYLSTLEHNKRAYALYERCGFFEEGFFKDHIYHRGSYKSLFYMAKFRN